VPDASAPGARQQHLPEDYFGLIEAGLVFGLAIAFYVWQRRDLKKAEREAREREARLPPDEQG
jgi:hypothetical protein